MIRESYPSHFKGEFNPEGFKLQTKMWHGIFKEIAFQEVSAALGAWIAEEIFPPVPANLNKILKTAKHPETFISPENAWEQVDKAVRRFGWVHERQALESLSQPIQRAIRNVGGWQKICSTPLGREWDFLRKNFMDVFEEFADSPQSEVLMPPNVKARLQEMSQKQLEAKPNDLSEM